MSKIRIQIVEDERIIALDIKNQLESMNYSVAGICDSGETAIDLAEKENPDVILMDIRLKGAMDGIEAAQKIHDRFDIPVIYLTSYADKTTLERARLTEPFGYLMKSFTNDTLKAAIEMTVYKHRMTKEKELLQNQLLQAQKLSEIGRLTGGVAHDFNNMLTIIKGYSEVAMISLDESSPLYNDLKQIKEAADQSTRLTHQLLLFSRNQPMTFSNIKTNEIIQNLLKMLERILGENILIETDLQDDTWEILGDVASFEQVIMNLAINAKDAMTHGGNLKIKTENRTIDEIYCENHPQATPGRYVVLSITDNGAGMDKKILNQIFTPFFTTKETGKGTGLGLSVVQNVVQKHRGWITVTSQQGKGSTFSVYLPSSRKQLEVEKEKIESWNDFKGNGERILLVEDDEGIREFAKLLFEENGYTVTDTDTAKRAWRAFQKEKKDFKLLFTDMVLPDGSGYRLAERIISQNKNIHVLLSSGYTDENVDWSLLKERNYAQ
jgi:two-component system cell cycle sensor histidine kinase/response regulator CckA